MKNDWTPDMFLARVRLKQWAAERTALRSGKVRNYTAPGRASDSANTNRFDAALVRCIDFERVLFSLPELAQSLLLLSYREGQTQNAVAEITACSLRAISYKLPAALADLALGLDRANLL